MGLESNTVNVSSRPASPSFESYEVILESVKRRVQETLLVSPKKGCLNKIKSLPRKDAPSSSSHHDSSRTTTAGRRRSFLELEDSDLDQEDDDLDWEFSDDETAGDGDSSQDIVPFRTDLGEEFGEVSVGIAQPLIKLESTVDDNDSILAQKDFHKELRKAEIFVDIQEKFIKKHLELKRLNQSTDMPKFIQGLVAEHMEELFP